MPKWRWNVGVKEKNLEENKVFKKLKDKKGFTLVELIVVLVILAILAALLVPALTGYIDKSKCWKNDFSDSHGRYGSSDGGF